MTVEGGTGEPKARKGIGNRRLVARGAYGLGATFAAATLLAACGSGTTSGSSAGSTSSSSTTSGTSASTKGAASGSPYKVSATWSKVGPTPHFTGVDPTTGHVFVSNLAAGTVTVLATSGSPVATVKTGGTVHTVMVDAKTGRTYVTDIKRGLLDVIDASTNKVLTEIPVGAHLHGLAVSSSLQEAVVTDVSTSKVYVVSTATDKVLTPGGIPVGANPWGVTIDAATHTAYVANTGMDPFASTATGKVNPAGSTVSVVNLLTDKVTQTIPVGPHPWNLVVTPSGTVYVGVVGTKKVAVIQGGKVVADIAVPGAPHGIGYSPSNGYVFVADSTTGQVSVIDTHTNKVVQNVKVGKDPQGLSVDTATGAVYVANQKAQSVSVLSPSAKG